MKRFIFLLAAFVPVLFLQTASAQKAPRLAKLWETDTTIRVPESVLFDATRSTLFVSLIDGMPWAADGKGGIAKMSLDGSNTDQDWITGLNCPKGMGIVGNKMYVADLTEVVIINIKKGTIETRIKPEAAVNLNDVAVAPKGVVYVSDSKAGRIYKVEDGKASLYMDSLPATNGLRFYNNELYAASGKNFIRINENKRITTVATLPMNGDGVEPIGDNNWLVTTWAGALYYVYADGRVITLLDTKDSKKNTADIGYDPYKKIIYIPTFFAKTVAAYELK